jgi:hypothetical protein
MPPELLAYFSAAATAAAALIGLLFVAIGLRPDSIFGPDAPALGRNLAVSAFVALANAFFVSLTALIARTSFNSTVIVMAVISLVSMARLIRRPKEGVSNLVITIISVLVYLSELAVGIGLNTAPQSTGLVYQVCNVTLFAFAVALVRAWLLIQGRHLLPNSRPSEGNDS